MVKKYANHETVLGYAYRFSQAQDSRECCMSKYIDEKPEIYKNPVENEHFIVFSLDCTANIYVSLFPSFRTGVEV